MADITIIGTAHVSQKSIDEVTAAIHEIQPDVVAIELDQGRYLGMKRQLENPSVESVLENKNFNQLLVQWVLAYIQRKIGMDVGVEPGADMKAASQEADQLGIPLALIDRNIGITLNRFWLSMSIFEKMKMFYALATSLAADDLEDGIDIDDMTKDDVVSLAMEEFHKFSPRGAQALIYERDAYMAHHIIQLAERHEKIIAVVGAGHKKGIETYLADPKTLPPLSDLTEMKKGAPWGKVLGGVVIALFALLLLAIAFSGVGLDVLLWALVWWVIVNGTLTFVFTLLAGGHVLSGLVGGLVSPVSSLNPLIAAGWFAALMEAKLRKPKPSDFRAIFDAESFSEMNSIPLFKVVFVAALANVGSTLGTIVYFLVIFPILGIDPTLVVGTGLSNMWAFLTGFFS
ncbi:MAG: TraB/GumN family protein [Methanomicrobiales archaeon]|jgi:pheromone shutdown-related protein TraB|nr:TraB/GumN family protein [Methanomicrobiales archaeon]